MHATRVWLLAICGWAIAPAAHAVDYVADVKPILKQHCYSCHGALRQKSGLRLDHVSFLRTGGDHGPAIASASDASPLILAVTGGGDVERMPLEAKPLSEAEIATLKAWVDAGAPAPDEPLPPDPRQHWSYQKPARAALPEVSDPRWSAHPIDRFLAAEHAARGLLPAEPAAKNVLLRRVYLDLVGVPPTPAELRAFLADESPQAYEHVVDRLLASPQYGERWGRHWMDVWRYSDWDGYAAEVRESQPHIWRWRDWIIDSLNADKSYARMIEEMLAADEIAPDDEGALRASGFLVRNWYKFNRNVWLEAAVEHTSKAFLATTMNCARCHDHMYDPILQTEYYQFRAIFEPHGVRTDRLPGQRDVKLDGLVRTFDEKAGAATYLFARGDEARPDKEHPLAPAVPRALGGELRIEQVALAPSQYYPGLRDHIVAEELSVAETAVGKQEAAMAKSQEALAAARKALTDFTEAKAKSTAGAPAAPAAPPADGAPAAPPADKAAAEGSAPAATIDESSLAAAVEATLAQTNLAEQSLLTASAELAAVRAKIAADRAAFAVPPAADAATLAREASRAQRMAEALRTRGDVLRSEHELAVARAGGEATKKKAEDAEKQLAEARKAHETAQAALAKSSDEYARFTPVYPNASTGRRTALARWIASPENSLTARVAINHMWLRHFGSPLVATTFDFGLNGKRPSHPALLDWLAVELMEQGWRMKPIHRLMVTSHAYRMASSSANESNQKADPENVYLWRMNPRRMEAEAVRDSTLAVAGSLDPAMFGPELDQNQGMTVPRRSIYFRSSKEKKMTFLDLFDRANVTDCYRRIDTVVPQQALAMINSSLALAEARRLAATLGKQIEAPATPEGAQAFVAAAFEHVLCRPPTAEEQTLCVEFLAEQSRKLAEPGKLEAFVSADKSHVPPAADPHARARENLVHVLMNHNDFVTIR
ncbi:MAG: DUF1553 domain-containing protein [Pirellulales bacterium]